MSADPAPPATASEAVALAEGDLRPVGFLDNASNHTLLAQVGAATDGRFAVYKPRAGERPLWDFPTGTLCQREAAAFEVSQALGWHLVPPTVLRTDGPAGPGSLQAFVPHDPQRHYFTLVQAGERLEPLARMAVFDLLVNNADRKASHVLVPDEEDAAPQGILGCDHGLCFHVEPKLRTVIWDLGAHPVPAAWREDVAALAATLREPGDELTVRLGQLLSAAELEALAGRAEAVATLEALPALDPEERPYPWPPL